MATPVDPQTPSVSGQEKRHVRFVEVSPRDEDQKFQDVTEESGAHLSVWSAGLFISKWRSAQRRGVRARLYTDDPEYRRVLREQELQLRSTVPLPLASAMDQETLHILLNVEKSYRRSLGPHHTLTTDAQRRIQTLRDRRSARGVRDETETSTWSRWTPFRRTQNTPQTDLLRRAQSPETETSTWSRWTPFRTDRRAQSPETETEKSVLGTWSRWTPFRTDIFRRAQSPETETSVLDTWSRWTPFRRDIFRRAQSPETETSVLNTWSRWTPFRRDIFRRAQSPETETSVLDTWSRWTPFRRDIFRRAQSPETETSVLNTWSRWTPFIFRRAQSPDHTSV